MNVRLVACISSVCLAVTATQAVAGTKKPKRPSGPVICNMINDPTPDAIVDVTNGIAKKGQQDDMSDVVSADLASDAQNLTAVIRLKAMSTPDTAWPEAHFYLMEFSVPGHSSPVYLGATIDPNPAVAAYGTQYYFGDVANFPPSGTTLFIGFTVDQAAHVKGTIDTAKATITLSVPISQLAGFGNFAPGAKFTDINAQGQVLVNGPDTPTNIPLFGGTLAQGIDTPDTDTAAKPYIAGTPSCVKPGS